MLTFIIESVVICIVFMAMCMLSVDGMMKNLEFAKLNYPEKIVERLVELGKVSDEKAPSFLERMKRKWPLIIVFGIIMGVLAKYINGCTTFFSAFAISYLLWTVVTWYDAFVIDCLWFCHSKRCIIPGTEDLTDAYHDYMFHIKGSLRGMVMGLICSLLAGLTVMVLEVLRCC